LWAVYETTLKRRSYWPALVDFWAIKKSPLTGKMGHFDTMGVARLSADCHWLARGLLGGRMIFIFPLTEVLLGGRRMATCRPDGGLSFPKL